MNVNKPKVLLVGDNEYVRKFHGLMLQGLGCEVVEAVTPLEALEKITAGFDLIMLDIEKPGLTNIDIVKIYRHHEAIQKQMPIILLNGNQNKLTQVQCEASGGTAVFDKPLYADTMEKIINQHCKESN